MDEETRRRLLWVILAGSTAWFLLTLLLVVTGNLGGGWYETGIAVYAVLFVLAIVGFILEKRPEPAQAQPAAPPQQLVTVREVASSSSSERVLYLTPRGQVLERTARANGAEDRDYQVETQGEVTMADAIEQRIDAQGWPAGKHPEEERLRAGLTRWGRIREGV